MKNSSWKDKRLHVGETLECTGTDVEICLMSDVQCRLESSSGSTATGADDCHALERNVSNEEMSNSMWIGVGLVITSDVGYREPRHRPSSSAKGPEEDEKRACEVRSTST